MTDPYISAQKRLDSGEVTDNRDNGDIQSLLMSEMAKGYCQYYSFKGKISNEQDREGKFTAKAK